MSYAGYDQDHNATGKDHHDTYLNNDGAISLFISVINNALEKHKRSLVNNLKLDQAKVQSNDQTELTLKGEGIKIQHLFNSERFDKFSAIESCLKLKQQLREKI